MFKKFTTKMLGRLGAKNQNAKFVHLHIPKTAGSAVKASIAKADAADLFASKKHHVAFEDLSQAELRQETFVTIRHPIPWYLSMYNFKMHSNSEKGYDKLPGSSFQDFIEDVVLAQNGLDGVMKWNRPVEFKKHVVRMLEPYFETGAHKKIGFLTLNYLFYATAGWRDVLKAPDPVEMLLRADTPIISSKHVLRQETLSVDFAKMVGGISAGINLEERVNEMTSNPYTDELSPELIAEIEQRDRFIISAFYGQA